MQGAGRNWRQRMPRTRTMSFFTVVSREIEMRLLAIAVTVFGLAAGPVLAQTQPDGTPTRIRGTVETLDGPNLMVKSREGQSLSVVLAPNVEVITLVKKTLADI